MQNPETQSEEEFPKLSARLRDLLKPPPFDELAEARDEVFRRSLREQAQSTSPKKARSIGPRPVVLAILGLAAALLFGLFLLQNSFGPEGNRAERETSQVQAIALAEHTAAANNPNNPNNPKDLNRDGNVDVLDAYFLAMHEAKPGDVEILLANVVALNE